MLEDRKCRKCGKKESKSEMPWMSPYGVCNLCHSDFLPYIIKAFKKFLKHGKKSLSKIQR